MPQTVTGEGYRDFSEPRFFEAVLQSQIEQIRQPVDKAHVLVAAADGSTNLAVWKFDASSTAASSSTVIVPLNPAFASLGRWIDLQVGSGSGNTTSSSGSGSPEGVVSRSPGALYWDTTGQSLYVKNTGSGNTGWLSILTL